MALAQRLRRRLSADGGFTLVEMLTAIAVGTVVGSIILGIVTVGLHQQTEVQDRNSVLTAERTALQRIDRDIRGADPLLAAGPTSVAMRETPPAGSSVTARTVTYSVVASGGVGQLVVDETDTSSSGSTVLPRKVLLSNLTNSSVFAFSEWPSPYSPPTGVGSDCSMQSSPGTYDPGCVGTVTTTLSVQQGRLTAPVTITDNGVDLRNAA